MDYVHITIISLEKINKTNMNYLSVTEYAKKYKITRQAVLKRIKRSKLKATKVGTTYIIKEIIK